MYLLKVQKNDIFDLVVQTGFSPLQFTIEEIKDAVTILSEIEKTRIAMVESGYYFELAIVKGKNIIRFSPGSDKLAEEWSIPPSWSEKKKYISRWLQNLKQELDLPDKWADFLKSGQTIEWNLASSEGERFSYQEVEEIIAAKERAKIKISELRLLPEQFHLIEGKLDYIAEKSKSLGKVDWKNIMIGTLVSLVVQLALPPETASALWLIFKEAFQRVILIALH
jgi:hypothetical protein